MSANAIKAGEAFVEFTMRDASLNKSLDAARKRIEEFGSRVTRFGKSIAGFGAVIAAPLALSARAFLDVGKNLAEMSARTGVSASALSELSYVAKQNGTDIETLEEALRKMQLTLLEAARGGEAAKRVLAGLGLVAEDVLKLSIDKQFESVAEKIGLTVGPTAKLKAAMDIFGKSGARLLPILSGGATAIQRFRKEAASMGASMSEEDVAAAAELDAAMTRLQSTFAGVTIQIGSALAPAITEIANVVRPAAQALAVWLKQNKELVLNLGRVAGLLVLAGGAFAALGNTTTAIGKTLGVVAKSSRIVGSLLAGTVTTGFRLATIAASAFQAALIALKTVSGIAALFGAASGLFSVGFWVALAAGAVLVATKIGDLGKVFTWLKNAGTSALKAVGTAVDGAVAALSRGDFQAAGDLLWAGVTNAWTIGTNDLRGIIETFIYDISDMLNNGISWSKTFLIDYKREFEDLADIIATKSLNIFEKLSQVGSETVDGFAEIAGELGFGTGPFAGSNAEMERINDATEALDNDYNMGRIDKDEFKAQDAALASQWEAAQRMRKQEEADLLKRRKEGRQATQQSTGANDQSMEERRRQRSEEAASGINAVERERNARLAELEKQRKEAEAAGAERLRKAQEAYDAALKRAKGPEADANNPDKPNADAAPVPGFNSFDSSSLTSSGPGAVFGGAMTGQVFGATQTVQQTLNKQTDIAAKMLGLTQDMLDAIRKRQKNSEPAMG